MTAAAEYVFVEATSSKRIRLAHAISGKSTFACSLLEHPAILSMPSLANICPKLEDPLSDVQNLRLSSARGQQIVHGLHDEVPVWVSPSSIYRLVLKVSEFRPPFGDKFFSAFEDRRLSECSTP